MLLLDFDGGADHSLGLHRGDLRIGDSQTAASVAHHRVELVEPCDDVLDLLDGLALRGSQLLDLRLLGGNELVQRRIQEADGDRVALKSLIESLEVSLLIRKDLVQSLFSLFDGIGADHLAERGDPLRIEEHVLGTAEADTLGAKLSRLLRVGRGVCVGSDFQLPVLVGPCHDAAELAGDLCVDSRDHAVIDVAGGSVDGDEVAFLEGLAAQLELLVLFMPETQHSPMPRATTAAWLVMPPRTVRIP